MACCVHHVEIGVKNGLCALKKLTNSFPFKVIATRQAEEFRQWVVRTGSAMFLLTEPLESRVSSESDVSWDRCLRNHEYISNWSENINQSTRSISKKKAVDSVFNIALEVKEVERMVERVARFGGKVVRPPRQVENEHGTVTYATVKSVVGNINHTLINSSEYSGVFLPGFKSESENVSVDMQSNHMLSHFDHVTYACPMGVSNQVLKWYEDCFGMERFLINSDEDRSEGFLVEGNDVGMRLMAMEYWKCAETGVSYPCAKVNSLKIVVAEPLPGQGPNQVETFLEQHDGPGVQHIGLHTGDIISSSQLLRDRGVVFLKPPPAYYSKLGKLAEIEKLGMDAKRLQECGVLVDDEADAGQHVENCNRMGVRNHSTLWSYWVWCRQHTSSLAICSSFLR
ncbi:4-hydroxyphenylpyruvate dioxygenase-like protein isoform X2 [Lingula anatina]|uniref:4-hydroxyphenylpyruvate dioxygenase-like protein isoform X2 n=1 Tax=Lingula anatina TaxID=7574 RepID=A0A1S3HAF6_LINAN|nr:4-hydroxyphenylpyruvate dioxygenase-like protein isoform X2 [Lingula anatina]|eukprot:XP_013382993.1 4-hydroxyphenylpyruvate dioxygenase-like protein isoform X2 [Lingula anatina]